MATLARWTPCATRFGCGRHESTVRIPLFQRIQWPSRRRRILANGWAPTGGHLRGHEGVTLRAEVPGFGAGDIDLRIENATLTLKGERKLEKEARGNYRRIERVYGAFSRSFSLPSTVDTEQGARRSRRTACSTVFLPRREESKPSRFTSRSTVKHEASRIPPGSRLGRDSRATFRHVRAQLLIPGPFRKQAPLDNSARLPARSSCARCFSTLFGTRFLPRVDRGIGSRPRRSRPSTIFVGASTTRRRRTDAGMPGDALRQRLSRKPSGAYYTPAALARHMCRPGRVRPHSGPGLWSGAPPRRRVQDPSRPAEPRQGSVLPSNVYSAST